PHPCNWVHAQVQNVSEAAPGVVPVVSLARHLFPLAMFRGQLVETLAENVRSHSKIDAAQQPISNELTQALGRQAEQSGKPIREALKRGYAMLDPGSYTPPKDDPLRRIEDTFSQSVALGKSSQAQGALSPLEAILLDLLTAAEAEWDLMTR